MYVRCHFDKISFIMSNNLCFIKIRKVTITKNITRKIGLLVCRMKNLSREMQKERVGGITSIAPNFHHYFNYNVPLKSNTIGYFEYY